MSKTIEHNGSSWIFFKGKISTHDEVHYQLISFDDEFAVWFHPINDVLVQDGNIYLRMGSKVSKIELKPESKYYDREKCDDCSCSD